MTSLALRFVRDESASVAVEYGLLTVLIAIAAIAALESLGLALRDMFDSIRHKLDNAVRR